MHGTTKTTWSTKSDVKGGRLTTFGREITYKIIGHHNSILNRSTTIDGESELDLFLFSGSGLIHCRYLLTLGIGIFTLRFGLLFAIGLKKRIGIRFINW